MSVRIFAGLAAVLLLVASSCTSNNVTSAEPQRASSTVTTFDVTDIWNANASAFNFRQKSPVITFAQAYYGNPSNLNSNFAAIKHRVNRELELMTTPGGTGSGVGDVMTTPGGIGSGVGDVMSVGIENWVYEPTGQPLP